MHAYDVSGHAIVCTRACCLLEGCASCTACWVTPLTGMHACVGCSAAAAAAPATGMHAISSGYCGFEDLSSLRIGPRC